jgi:hypothetical protein
MHPLRAGHHEVDLPVRPTTLVMKEAIKVCGIARPHMAEDRASAIGEADHAVIMPSMQVTVSPPIQISLPARST